MKNIKNNYTTRQLKLPLEIEKLININDEVYTFCEIMDNIDLTRYFVEKGYKTGRPRCNSENLLKVILFAFMEHGEVSLRDLEKLCRNDIRYMYLLDDMKPPSHTTLGNFINKELKDTIGEIFLDINSYIFEKEAVDISHVYIDGTKLEANANKYTWVWKKSCIRNRNKVFVKISELLEDINKKVLVFLGIKLETRIEYTVEYMEEILKQYIEATRLDITTFVSGRGKRKSIYQKQYENLKDYTERLKTYAKHIKICGDFRNSYSKSDHDATFMRVKRDYMGNDQLIPSYNVQAAVCDEYIAVIDVKQYASDMDCFIPLMEKFKVAYGKYPKYPVADAGYGSFNNYIYCEEHGMEKFMKFTMFNKEINDKNYLNNPYRAANFKINENNELVCPNNKRFLYKSTRPIRNNNYGRTEEIYECENCKGCKLREKCTKTATGNRTIRINKELTAIHKEVINNLETVQGTLLFRNRCIQSEGTFGIIKWNRCYKRITRRGLENVMLELMLIACGFNLHKYHNKKYRHKLYKDLSNSHLTA